MTQPNSGVIKFPLIISEGDIAISDALFLKFTDTCVQMDSRDSSALIEATTFSQCNSPGCISLNSIKTISMDRLCFSLSTFSSTAVLARIYATTLAANNGTLLSTYSLHNQDGTTQAVFYFDHGAVVQKYQNYSHSETHAHLDYYSSRTPFTVSHVTYSDGINRYPLTFGGSPNTYASRINLVRCNAFGLITFRYQLPDFTIEGLRVIQCTYRLFNQTIQSTGTLTVIDCTCDKAVAVEPDCVVIRQLSTFSHSFYFTLPCKVPTVNFSTKTQMKLASPILFLHLLLV